MNITKGLRLLKEKENVLWNGIRGVTHNNTTTQNYINYKYL